MQETLRLYPVGPHIQREAVEDTALPLSKPIQTRDGNWISEIPIPKGTHITSALGSYHRYVLGLVSPHRDDAHTYAVASNQFGEMNQTSSDQSGG